MVKGGFEMSQSFYYEYKSKHDHFRVKVVKKKCMKDYFITKLSMLDILTDKHIHCYNTRRPIEKLGYYTDKNTAFTNHFELVKAELK
jgi:hypothetical protein